MNPINNLIKRTDAVKCTTNRRKFLRNLSAIAGVATVRGVFPSLGNNTGQEKLNILWLDVEDLSPDLGCYRNPYVKTPNLDRLAGEGALFNNSFATSPVYSPCRLGIITGMYHTSIGAHHHRSHHNDGYNLPDGIKLVSQYLKEAGYFTCNGQALEKDHRGKTDYNFTMDFKDAFDGTNWNQRKPDQPFFTEVHFNEAHRDFKLDPENPIDPDKIDIPPYYPDHPITRMDWTLYLETVQILDKKVGKMLKRMEDEGLTQNAVVFFTGDHGRPMVRGKQWLYDSGIRIPLIIRWPGKIAPGTVVEKLVNTIDLAPTWLSIAGVQVPSHLQRINLFGLHTGERKYIFAARDRCDETDDRIRCVRSKRFKYIRNFYPERPYTYFNAYKKIQYPVLTLMEVLHKENKLTPVQAQFMADYRPVEELYDIQKDPHEVQNLAKDLNYASTQGIQESTGRMDLSNERYGADT